MTESKHTPGPWTRRGAEVFAAGRRVADCDDHVPYVRNPEDEANAALIAATPDLLAACEKLLNWMHCIPDHYETLDEDIAAAKTAVAKATGE